jgi:hypothetical protein
MQKSKARGAIPRSGARIGELNDPAEFRDRNEVDFSGFRVLVIRVAICTTPAVPLTSLANWPALITLTPDQLKIG